MKRINGPEYEVGYCKPPEQTRFKKGQSGNPAGRPRGSLSLAAALNKALSEKITVTENGRVKQMSKLEAAVKGMINRAVKGDAKAFHHLVQLGPLVGVDPAGPQVLGEADAAVIASMMQRLNPKPPRRKKAKG